MGSTGKLGLSALQIDRCRALARRIVEGILPDINSRSTEACERTILRLWGVDGPAAGTDFPLVNAAVDSLKRTGRLIDGVALPVAALMASTGKPAKDVCQAVVDGSLDWPDESEINTAEAAQLATSQSTSSLMQIENARQSRASLRDSLQPPPSPWLYVIVATGNIYDDMEQAVSAVHAGADCIAVIRSTAQSLLDYVPEGATTEGFGGTYATGENFRLMREKLDGASRACGRYIRLVNYASGLCMPEISILAAQHGLDMLLNDCMYGIIFRDIHRMRTLVDQMLSRSICARFGIIINTGEDNYLTTADAAEAAHTVLASQLINESFALEAGMPRNLMGLGHAFEVDSWLPDSFLIELADAQLTRDVFPESPIKYMPPTRHKAGDIFFSHVMDAMFNLTSAVTGQSIHLCGMPTEAIHTPYMHDRFIALESARYIRGAAGKLAGEINYAPQGVVASRARKVLSDAEQLLETVAGQGLLTSLERGIFADTKRPRDKGRGGDGVFVKSDRYFDPLAERLATR